VKLSLALQTPEVAVAIPVALLSGSFDERLHKAAELGYDGVELMSAYPQRLDAKTLCSQLNAAGLRVAAIGSGAVYMTDKVSLLASSEETSRIAVERLDALIDFADSVGSGFVTIGGFRGRAAWVTGTDGRKRLAEILRVASQRASRKGVRLVLEPLNRYESDIINNATECIDFLQEIGSDSMGVVLDTYHMNIEEASFESCIEIVASSGLLWHIHLGDSNRLPPGKGHIDFPNIVKTLQKVGYSSYLSAELLPLPDPDQAAADTIDYMRRLMVRNGHDGSLPEKGTR
jgi:sugar phosphate isomerase/epimerase